MYHGRMPSIIVSAVSCMCHVYMLLERVKRALALIPHRRLKLYRRSRPSTKVHSPATRCAPNAQARQIKL